MTEKKVRCLISEVNDPYLNLATEAWIFHDMDPSQQLLFLWQNRDAVVIGRNQNPWAECHLQKIKEDGVHLVRRESGGGAVFQDIGNMNFTFLSSKKAYDKKRNYEIIINALKHFGIHAEMQGRNDIVVNGAKVSGSAFRESIDRAFHHGTLMIDVNLTRLGQYLTPSPKKLLAKGVKSVRSRVANLREFHPTISKELLREAIIKEFFQAHSAPHNVEVLESKSVLSVPKVQEYYQKLKSQEWIYGETPQFNHHIEERLSWGMFNIHFNVAKRVITDVKIYSDALNTALIDLLTAQLKGIHYDKEAIQASLAQLIETQPESKENIEEFKIWLVSHVD